MRIAFELRRPARRTAAVLLAVLTLAIPGVVLASHQFSDVPTGHSFHNQISAIAKAGITAGFPDGGYHPSDPVTRQAMAAFMERGLGRVGLAWGSTPMTASVSVAAGYDSTSSVPVRQLTITVPGAANAFQPNQLVHLRAHVVFIAQMSISTQGCPCEFAATIRDVTDNRNWQFQYEAFESSSNLNWFRSFDVEALIPASPGQRTYEVVVALLDRANKDNATSFALSSWSSLSAMTFPFGPTGTSSENVAPDDAQLPEQRRDE